MRLSDVLHQDRVHDRIQRAMAVDRIPHAFLFSGPEGVGKEMMALRLAAVLLCGDPRVEKPPPSFNVSVDQWRDACGRCVDCELHASGNHPDYHRIYRTLNKLHPDKDVQRRKATELGIDVIRHFVIDKIGLRPSRQRAKIFVVAEADRLNPHSQNALLKTLEEPPEHSYLILLSSSGDLLLDTTRSRCQQVNFLGLPIDFVDNLLKASCGADPPSARLLAELTQGSAGRAVLYYQIGVHELAGPMLDAVAGADADPIAFARTVVDLSKKLSTKIQAAGKADDDDAVEGEDTADLNAGRMAQGILLGLASAFLRDVQRCAVGLVPAVTADVQTIRRLASRANLGGLRSAIRSISSGEYQIGRNAQAQLVFDVVGLSIHRAFATGTTKPATIRS